MKINAAKTKVTSIGKGDSRLPAIITISGGQVEQVGSFKYLGVILTSTAYLGGILTSIANLGDEVNAHRSRRLGAFA
jgi:hypothetical protein